MLRECIVCTTQFVLTSAHIGFANRCSNCNAKSDVERVMAEVSWENKHTPIINITTAARARKFNRAQRRAGASVLLATLPTPDPGSREEHSASPGTVYTSKLGEKHATKR